MLHQQNKEQSENYLKYQQMLNQQKTQKEGKQGKIIREIQDVGTGTS